MPRDDEFDRLAAEYAASHRMWIKGGVGVMTEETNTDGGQTSLHRRMYAAMRGADTMTATLATGQVVTATVRPWWGGGYRFEVKVDPSCPADYAPVEDVTVSGGGR